MIVECPSCLTKFSIDSQQLANIDDPRFNCCRCGSYFELQQTQAEAIEAITTKSSSPQTTTETTSAQVTADESTQSGTWLIDETLFAAEKNTASKPSTDTQPEWVPDPEAELEDLFAPKKAGEQLNLLNTEVDNSEIEVVESEPKEQWSLGQESSGQQATRDESTADESTAGESTAQDLVTAEWPDASPRKKTPTPSITTTFSQSTQTPKTPNVLETKKKTKIAELLAQAKARSDEEFEEQLSRVNLPETKPDPAKLSSKDAAQEKEKRRARKRAKKQQKLIRDITFREKRALGKLPKLNIRQQAPISCIASVPVLLLLIVTFIASNLEELPLFVQQVLQVDTDSLPRLPPAGLGIVDLSSSVITLDSGHRALEIRGELLNATSESFHDIRLLASLFNSANEKINSLVVNPENELRGAQVVALDAEAIQRLQSRRTIDSSEVVPNERLAFRIVFPTYRGTEKWFSTSVYSVEREPQGI